MVMEIRYRQLCARSYWRRCRCLRRLCKVCKGRQPVNCDATVLDSSKVSRPEHYHKFKSASAMHDTHLRTPHKHVCELCCRHRLGSRPTGILQPVRHVLDQVAAQETMQFLDTNVCADSHAVLPSQGVSVTGLRAWHECAGNGVRARLCSRVRTLEVQSGWQLSMAALTWGRPLARAPSGDIARRRMHGRPQTPPRGQAPAAALAAACPCLCPPHPRMHR